MQHIGAQIGKKNNVAKKRNLVMEGISKPLETFVNVEEIRFKMKKWLNLHVNSIKSSNYKKKIRESTNLKFFIFYIVEFIYIKENKRKKSNHIVRENPQLGW